MLRLRYRSVPDPDAAPFPRTGNLWGWWQLAPHDLADLAKIDLWLGCDGIPPETARALRQRNPHAVFLASINAVEANEGAPADYYLRDTAGNRVETWPGAWRLNLTRPEVADWKARQIVQRVVDSGLLYDGVFFDNVFLSQSWQDHDIYGRPFPVDADGNGVKDDAATFDRLWREGVLRELALFRQLMPHALVNGHAMPLTEPAMRATFHGISLGFIIPQVIEGRKTFGDVWANYRGWLETARPPRFTMVESAPPYQIGYGYGYSPNRVMPPATLEWARTWYPNMRFGLAFTLLHDGVFCHEVGDTHHGDDWWYDELDYELGFPLGAARRLELSPPGAELITNGDFAAPLNSSAWSFWAADGTRLAVALEADPGSAASRVVRLDATQTDGLDWHVSFWAAARTLVNGTSYALRFRARADRERPLTVGAQKDKADWRNYGLSRQLTLGPAWQDYEVIFTATDNAVADARIQFHVGAVAGPVWLDDVSLRAAGPEVWRRDYERGVVLLNASRNGQTIDVGPGFHRLAGAQAPRHQFIVDDADAAFATVSGTWAAKTYDTGEWGATAPYYHDWGPGCRESSGPGAAAQWSFAAPDTDDFALDAWWPALPGNPFSAQARYDLLVGGAAIASVTLDQSKQGDEWHRIGTVRATAGATIAVRVQPLDSRPCLADAIHVTSTLRFNDGTAAASVRLQPMDGIVLRRDAPSYATPVIARPPAAVTATI
ncbi:MAG: putative glycoside hydrolase, partial [Planctomycetota bacterium]|nr:putative glycoside hydrolase [Planctomycetota bacterium]